MSNTFKVLSSFKAEFSKNGEIFYSKSGGAGGGRGFNIAAIDLDTGALIDRVQNFDTWISRNTGVNHWRMIEYINSIPDGTFIMIATADEAGLTGWLNAQCTKLSREWIQPTLESLESLGARKIRDYCYRDYWILMTIKGRGQALVEDINKEHKTALAAEIIVPLDIDIPVLESPAHKERVYTTTPVFNWSDAEGVDSYAIEVARDALFQDKLVEVSNIRESMYAADQTLAIGEYYWRVRARNQEGRGGLFSPSLQFQIDPSPVITFEIESGGKASFKKDGEVFYSKGGGAGGGRGFNIAAIHKNSGELIGDVRNFDTWGSRNNGVNHRAMINFVNGLPDGTLLLIAVADEAGLTGWAQQSCVHLDRAWVRDTFELFERLGSTQLRNYCYRNSWLLAAVKGEGKAIVEKEGVATLSAEVKITRGISSVFGASSSHRTVLSKDGIPFYEKSGGAGGGRGFNIAVVDAHSGEVQEVRNFDTWGSRNTGVHHRAMMEYIDTIPEGAFIMMATADEAGLTHWGDSSCTKINRSWIPDILETLREMGSLLKQRTEKTLKMIHTFFMIRLL